METISRSSHNLNDEKLLYQKYVVDELKKAKKQAADPDTQWLEHDIVWKMVVSK